MQSQLTSKHQRSPHSAPCALWPVDLKLTHLDWNPEATLIHFQGQYLTICELDYNILQGEIQNIPKSKASVNVGEFCLVEDLTSARWYRGRVQNRKQDLFDIFLIDHGNVLTVDSAHISTCSNDLFILPPKIVCGFLANVLLLQGCSHSVVEDYFAHLIGRHVTGYIQALLPHKVLLLEASDINFDLVKHGFGRHVDTDTFLLLVEMLTEVPLKQNSEPVPDLLIEKPRGQEFIFKSSGLQGYEDILSFCGPRLSCGTRARVRVTAAVNPGLFWCQKASMETDLLEMSKKLAAVTEYRTNDHYQKTQDNLGLLCSVKGKDGKWYRGFVQFLPVNSQVRVLFIDYGFYESVKVENVHRLPHDFYSTPIMAFPCLLPCLGEENEAVKTQLSFLKAGLLGRMLDVEITSFDEAQNLYSITVIGTEDNHVEEPEPIQELPRVKVQSVSEKEDLSPQGGYLCIQTTMGEALGTTLKEEEVQVDSVFVGYVEHALNPNHFWIRTQKRNDEFEEMMKNMENHFSQTKLDEDVLTNPKPGTLCCAVYEEDMHFYRGLVTDTLEHGAEVLFMDFGNIEKVPHMLIKKIPEKFTSQPAFAFCCTLVNVYPLDEVWTAVISDFFKRAVSNKALLVKVVQMRKNKCVVNLYEMGSEKNQSISELLISSNRAEYWKDIPVEPMVLNNTSVTGKKTQRRTYGVKSDIKVDTEQLWDCEEKEEMSKNDIEKAKSTAILQDLEQGLATEVTISTKLLPTVCPESFVYSSFDLKPGNEEQVYITHVSSQWEVFCHLERNFGIIEELEMKITRESEKMIQASTRAVESNLCLAKYWDGKWYRGLAHPLQSPQHLSVFFVDYGNITISEKTQAMFMPRDSADLLYTPMQALRCSLASVSKEELYSDVKDWLDDAILNKQVRAVIAGNNEDGSINVELFDGDVNINEKVNEQILSLLPKPDTVGSFDIISGTNHRTEHGEIKKPPIKSKSKCKGQSSKTQTSNAHRGTQVRSGPHIKRENTKNDVHDKAQTKKAKVKLPKKEDSKSSVALKPQTNSQVEQQMEFCETDTKSEKPQYTKDTKIPQKTCLAHVKVSAGFRAKCFVSHINSMNSFFLQMPEDEPAILKMAIDLNSDIFRDSLQNNTSLIQINDLVLAEYEEDGALYRAAVKDNEGSSCFKVEFVDYGNPAVIGQDKIYSIPEEYLSQPRLSISCSMLDTSAYENDAAFTDAVMEKPLMVDFVRQYEAHWKVKLEIDDGAVGLPVAQEAAVESSTESEMKEEASVSSSEMEDVSENETAKSEINVPTVDRENMLKPQPVMTKVRVIISRRYRRPTTRNKGHSKKNNKGKQRKTTKSSVKVKSEWADVDVQQIATSLQQNEEMVLSPAENRNEKAERHSSLDPKPPHQLVFAPIDIDKSYSGLAAAVTTPFEFCVVLDDLLLVMNKVSMMLDDLPSEMTPLPEAYILPGTCCLLKSESKNKWCRAEIVQADATAVLNLVDYGLYECIPYEDCSNLKSLPEEIMNLPKVTYPCILRGVKPVGVDGQWTDEASVFFQQCLYQKNQIKIFFREFVSNTQWKVDILADGIHIAKELVDAGHASFIDIMLGLRFQEQSPCKAPRHSPESDEDCGQDDEGFDQKSELYASVDEAEGKTALSVVSGPRKCFLM